MSAVVIVDTCVFLNVLDVPAFNQHRNHVLEIMESYLDDDSVTMLLPMAAIIETGNHIAQLADGRQRRRFAELFADQVRQALQGNAPWRPTPMPNVDSIALWLDIFPNHAMQGVGMGDLSIIKEWEAACTRHPRHRVTVWSLDHALVCYDRTP